MREFDFLSSLTNNYNCMHSFNPYFYMLLFIPSFDGCGLRSCYCYYWNSFIENLSNMHSIKSSCNNTLLRCHWLVFCLLVLYLLGGLFLFVNDLCIFWFCRILLINEMYPENCTIKVSIKVCVYL